MIEFYNSEVRRCQKASHGLAANAIPDAGAFVDADPKKISWTREAKQSLERGIERAFEPNGVRRAVYRPFHKTWIYFNRHFNNCVYQMPRVFPRDQADVEAAIVELEKLENEFVKTVVNEIPDQWQVSRSSKQSFADFLTLRARYVVGSVLQSIAATCWPDKLFDS